MLRGSPEERQGMRIAVFGAGAVGGHIAARLGAAGHPVSIIARGESVAAIRRDGITVRAGTETFRAHVVASDDPRGLGVQDLVVVTVKATAPGVLANGLAPLVGPKTEVVFAQNGIPWWYGLGIPPSLPPPPDLAFLDPEGALTRMLAVPQICGAVIHSSNEVVAPGVIVNDTPQHNVLYLGRADDGRSGRLDELRRMLEGAGFSAPPVERIRQAVWGKLIVNMSLSILCLLTGRKATVVREDARLGAIFLATAGEGIATARAHGIDANILDPRAILRNPPDHTPSIRQDYDRRRDLEIDALLLAPQAFARAAGVDTPHLDTIAALAARIGADRGLYRDRG
jgi:2-dehydropantoate 2-reductase